MNVSGKRFIVQQSGADFIWRDCYYTDDEAAATDYGQKRLNAVKLAIRIVDTKHDSATFPRVTR